MTKNNSNKPLFYIIALCIPVVLLALAEGVLRLVNFGQSYPLFVESEQFPEYLQPNPKIINCYFPDPSVAPKVSPDTVYFRKSKPQDSFRIVIQGGSSAAGFPFGRFGSLQGMLEQRVKRLYPDKNIEIINTAMAAVNSYTLLDFVEEIIAIQPDLVLIYTGHNEYLGVMGAASNFAAKGGRFATLSYLYLKDFKLYQLLQSAFFNFHQPEVNANVSERTLMAQVAKGKSIALDSDEYQQGKTQFAGNLADILTNYQQRNIPVLLGNLVSIEKDMQPFSSVGKKDSEAFQLYQQGMALLQQGKAAQARANLTKAKDLDQIRFRAPSEFNQIIKQQVQAFDNVELVDVEAKFRADSKDGILGYRHLLEHVHPTKRGYFLLAEAFVDVIIAVEYLGQPLSFSVDKAWQDIPVTALNEAYAKLKVQQLTSDYPFRAEPIVVAAPDKSDFLYPFLMSRINNQDWLAIQHELQKAYIKKGDFIEAARVAGIIADALPNSINALNLAGQLYMKLSDFSMAIYYQNKALKLKPDDVNSRLNLAHSLFLTQQYEDSLQLLEQAKRAQPDNLRIQFFIDKVEAGAKGAADEKQ